MQHSSLLGPRYHQLPLADLAHLYISGALLLMCHVVSGVGRPGSRIAATLNTEYEGFASLWASDNENTLIHDDTHFVPKYKFFLEILLQTTY